MPLNDVTGPCPWWSLQPRLQSQGAATRCQANPTLSALPPFLCIIRRWCAAAMTTRGWRLSSSECSTSSRTPSPCSTSTSLTRPYTRRTRSVSLHIYIYICRERERELSHRRVQPCWTDIMTWEQHSIHTQAEVYPHTHSHILSDCFVFTRTQSPVIRHHATFGASQSLSCLIKRPIHRWACTLTVLDVYRFSYNKETSHCDLNTTKPHRGQIFNGSARPIIRH